MKSKLLVVRRLFSLVALLFALPVLCLVIVVSFFYEGQ